MREGEKTRSQERSFINTTASICPRCQTLVAAQVFEQSGQVFMKKFCPAHGHFEVLLASDAAWYRQTSQIAFRPQQPYQYGAKVVRGCPNDCGICPDHQQRCMIGVIEITDHCSLDCPICFAYNRHSFEMTPAEMNRCLDAICASEQTQLASLVISGGEPTRHPRFFELLQCARERGFANITVNTNGTRIAEDADFCAQFKALGLQATMWMDGLRESTHLQLRGRDHRAMKTAALANLEKFDINTNLLMVVGRGINEDEVGEVLRLGMERHFVNAVTFHALAYTGKGGSTFPDQPCERVTLPHLMRLIEEQSGFLAARDFTPIPAPHPLCESATYLLLPDDDSAPIAIPRLVSRAKCLAMLDNTAILRPDDQLEGRLRQLIDELYASKEKNDEVERALAFFRRLLLRCFPPDGRVTPAERARICERAVKAVVLVPYMDELNLDLTRLRACIAMQALPDGRLIPSCAYLPLHRLRRLGLQPEPRPHA